MGSDGNVSHDTKGAFAHGFEGVLGGYHCVEYGPCGNELGTGTALLAGRRFHDVVRIERKTMSARYIALKKFAMNVTCSSTGALDVSTD